ncbi:ATP-binding cassette domain-containing protein [Kamptonema cortianum]|nr:ATP-binding cassette domain-containing protein [Kamptonema cortianum]MDL5046222.1 ATP-binding cassette domain-containing protein [Oscillatoria amoena NRMC-F 0135]
MSTIIAEGLSKTYRTYRKKPGFWGALKGLVHREYEHTHAAREVSFRIEEGEFVGFLGPNGAGKTTTLKMLSGLLHPTSGRASVLGFVPWHRRNEFKRQFALVMGQKNALWWDLPAADSLELTRVIYGVDEAVYRRKLDELTTLLDVSGKLHVMVRELSLGERMKFELINALIYSPKVLFLDEPTIGLDVTSQKKVREFLHDYNAREKITMILTSHYMQDIQELCQRVMVIDHGRLMYDGRLDKIIGQFADHKIVGLQGSGNFQGRDFSVYGEVVSGGGSSIRLKVSRARIKDVCRELLNLDGVEDINIQEVPVEDVIRELFSRTGETAA